MNVKLVVVQGKPKGKEIPLRIPKFLIGRGTECHLRPNSELVSRHHCLLIRGNDELRLRDLGSTNGTLVNGERITSEMVLRSGDMIQVGPLGFELVMEPVPASVPFARPAASVATDDASRVPSADTATQKTKLEAIDGQDTKSDFDPPKSVGEPSAEPMEKVVESERDPKIEPNASAPKTEKSRDDTSRAAADILLRTTDSRGR